MLKFTRCGSLKSYFWWWKNWDFSHGQKEYPKWPAWCGSIPMFLSKGEPDHIVTLPGCCLRCLPRSPTTQVTQDPAANYASPETHAIQTTERNMWSSHWIFNVVLKEHLQEIMDIFHGFPQIFPTKSGRFMQQHGESLWHQGLGKRWWQLIQWSHARHFS